VSVGAVVGGIGALFFVVNGGNHSACSSILLAGTSACNSVNDRYYGGIVGMIVGFLFLVVGLIAGSPSRGSSLLRGLNVFCLLERASTYRPGVKRDIASLTKFSLRMPARRAIALEEEITEIDALLKPLVKETAPELVGALGRGTDAASALLVAAGDNPQRLRNEAAFAHLWGTSPIDASSGKSERHRLNRSGDHQANSALWHIVITRMVYDPRTSEYIMRRTKDGLTKKEAVRCLKRYVAREVYSLLPHEKLGLDNP
jgi:transposase